MKCLYLNVNSVDPCRMPHSAASDIGLHCLPISFLWDARLKWVNQSWHKLFFSNLSKGILMEVCIKTVPCPKQPGPSCSKLTTSLVNVSLKFTSSDTQIC